MFAPPSVCIPNFELRPSNFLLDKEHFPVRRQRPRLVRHQELDAITGLTQSGHRRHDLIADAVIAKRAYLFA